MLPNEQPIDAAVRVLNQAFEADPAVISQLVCVRMPCKRSIVEHHSIVCEPLSMLPTPEPRYAVGLLGILNGVLSVMTGKRITTMWDDSDPECAKFQGFTVYTGEVEPSACL